MEKENILPNEIIDYYDNILLKQQVPVGIKGKKIVWGYKKDNSLENNPFLREIPEAFNNCEMETEV